MLIHHFFTTKSNSCMTMEDCVSLIALPRRLKASLFEKVFLNLLHPTRQIGVCATIGGLLKLKLLKLLQRVERVALRGG